MRIEDSFNPNTKAYCDNPGPQCLALANQGRLVFFKPWQAWIMTQISDIMDCWKNEYLSSDFYDWEFAPQRPPEEQWGNFEKALIGHSLVADHNHHRLIRKITAPAFSRNVVDEINKRIEPEIHALFDRLGQPETFDYNKEISQHIPFISITKMIGIPQKYWSAIKPVIQNFTQTWNPTISEQRRNKAVEESNLAIDILKDVIAERKLSPQQDDFLSVLINIEKNNAHFEEWDILCLILALIGAGADTTLVAQQWTTYALLKHKDQVPIALSSAQAFSNTFNEVSRWGIISKMGFARYAPENMTVLDQKIKQGQMILLMPHLEKHNPKVFPNPQKFDVTRKFDPDIQFGYGPRYCIGAALAKHQLFLTASELFKRFPNIELAKEPERDESDHNSIVFKKLILKTHG